MNIKAAYTESVAAQTRDLIALMKLHEKLLISIKKIAIDVRYFEKTEDSVFDLGSNDAKVPPLQIAARAG